MNSMPSITLPPELVNKNKINQGVNSPKGRDPKKISTSKLKRVRV
jgi:hypothetical protein